MAYIIINLGPLIQDLWQVQSCDNLDQLCSCLKSLMTGYAEHIKNVNEMIKKIYLTI